MILRTRRLDPSKAHFTARRPTSHQKSSNTLRRKKGIVMKTAATLLCLFLSASVVTATQTEHRNSHGNAGPPTSKGTATTRTTKLTKTTTPSRDVRPQADEVEQLLVKYILAQGGVKLFAIRSRVMRGRVEISTSDLPGTFESYEKAPNKSMHVLNAPSGQFLQAYDGSSRWLQSPWGGLAFSEQSAGEILKKSAGKREFKFRNFFSSASLRGRAVVNGHETVVLAATPVGGRPLLMYFDSDTGLLRKGEFVRRVAAQPNELKAVLIDDYAEFEGVKVPVVFRQVYAEYTMTFRILEVKLNVQIDDSLFARPKGAGGVDDAREE